MSHVAVNVGLRTREYSHFYVALLQTQAALCCSLVPARSTSCAHMARCLSDVSHVRTLRAVISVSAWRVAAPARWWPRAVVEKAQYATTQTLLAGRLRAAFMRHRRQKGGGDNVCLECNILEAVAVARMRVWFPRAHVPASRWEAKALVPTPSMSACPGARTPHIWQLAT